jgi:hypothetical protein
LLILADIHANVSALEAVLRDAAAYHIDYGMRPNETIAMINRFP